MTLSGTIMPVSSEQSIILSSAEVERKNRANRANDASWVVSSGCLAIGGGRTRSCLIFSFFEKAFQTYGPTDGRTYGRTDPLIEMRRRI